MIAITASLLISCVTLQRFKNAMIINLPSSSVWMFSDRRMLPTAYRNNKYVD